MCLGFDGIYLLQYAVLVVAVPTYLGRYTASPAFKFSQKLPPTRYFAPPLHTNGPPSSPSPVRTKTCCERCLDTRRAGPSRTIQIRIILLPPALQGIHEARSCSTALVQFFVEIDASCWLACCWDLVGNACPRACGRLAVSLVVIYVPQLSFMGWDAEHEARAHLNGAAGSHEVCFVHLAIFFMHHSSACSGIGGRRFHIYIHGKVDNEERGPCKSTWVPLHSRR